MATAVITGASSGIGRDIAVILSDMGYDLILTARRKDRLQELYERLGGRAEIFCADLSQPVNCRSLYDFCRDKDVEILVNNAGFGYFGEFSAAPVETELEMIDLNIKAVHILTKLFLNDFISKNKGRILNVASSAGFMPAGPLLGTYYATKAYVLSLTRSVSKEIEKTNVTISALCPGPVKTEFNKVAGVEFAVGGMTGGQAARIAVRGMMRGKRVIIPGVMMKIAKFLTKILPDRLLTAFAYRFQKAKETKNG